MADKRSGKNYRRIKLFVFFPQKTEKKTLLNYSMIEGSFLVLHMQTIPSAILFPKEKRKEFYSPGVRLILSLGLAWNKQC